MMMSPLRWASLAVFAVLMGLLGAQTVRLADAKAEIAKCAAARSKDRADAAIAADKASTDYRAEEQRRNAALLENINAAQAERDRARADAANANAAARRLRDAATTFAASSSSTPAGSGLTPSGKTTGAPSVVLADLLGRVDDVAGELAAALDLSHSAGGACERAYDALNR